MFRDSPVVFFLIKNKMVMKRSKRTYNLRKKRAYRKKRLTVPRAVRQNLVSVKRTFNLGTIGHTVATGWAAYPYTFALADLPNASEFTTLFDAYKLNAVKLTFTPFYDSNDSVAQVGATVTWLPRVYTCLDRNGIASGALATEDLMCNYANLRAIRKPQEPFSIYINAPGVETGVLAGSSNLNAATKYKTWIDCVADSVTHNGCAIGWVTGGSASGVGWYYHVRATYYLQFKNIK